MMTGNDPLSTKNNSRKIRILGIDPGSRTTGYGVIDMDGNHATHVANGHLNITGDDLPGKLRMVFEKITALIEDHQPDEVAIEKVFMHRNADSALKLGQARGAAITACSIKSLVIFEYTANQVKQAIVGRGHAAKQQVQHMVKVLLCLTDVPQSDAADALAIALCHGHSRTNLLRVHEVSEIKDGRLR